MFPTERVLPTIKKYMLADGFQLVLDLKKSKGMKLYDALSGKTFIDFFTLFASSPLGFNHPKLLDEKFLEELKWAVINNPTNSDFYTPEMAAFVDTFARLAKPSYLHYLFFISGGALAVENALKTAFDWKIRKNFLKGYKEERGTKVIHFQEAFHGRSGYTLTLTNTFDKRKTKYFTKFNWPRVINPKLTFPLTPERIEEVKQKEEECYRQIRKAFADNPDDIAAIIIEPIQGEGGDNHFRKEFFHALRALANEFDVMLIFDEIQTGGGITGKMWACEHFDVKPDILVFGKKTQVCGIMCSKRVDEVENNVFHEHSRINSTWGGNLVDMLRCKKYLEIIEEERLIENAAKMGEYFLAELNNLSNEFPKKISNARGRGLFLAFDLPSSGERDLFKEKLFQNGVLVLASGEKTIRFRPVLNITTAEIDEGMEIIRKTVKELY